MRNKFVNRVHWYVNALINGTPLELMQRRYPDLVVEIGENSFSLREKSAEVTPEPEQSKALVPVVVPSENKTTVDLKIVDEDERAEAKRVADAALAAATPSKPLTPVE